MIRTTSFNCKHWNVKSERSSKKHRWTQKETSKLVARPGVIKRSRSERGNDLWSMSLFLDQESFKVQSFGSELQSQKFWLRSRNFWVKKLLTNLFWYRKTKMMKSEAKRCSPNDDQRCSKSFRQSLKGCKFFCEPFELSTIRTPNC